MFAPSFVWLLSEALRRGEASVVAPVQFLRLPAVAAMAWIFFGEVTTTAILLGGAAVLAAVVLLTAAEARQR